MKKTILLIILWVGVIVFSSCRKAAGLETRKELEKLFEKLEGNWKLEGYQRINYYLLGNDTTVYPPSRSYEYIQNDTLYAGGEKGFLDLRLEVKNYKKFEFETNFYKKKDIFLPSPYINESSGTYITNWESMGKSHYISLDAIYTIGRLDENHLSLYYSKSESHGNGGLWGGVSESSSVTVRYDFVR